MRSAYQTSFVGRDDDLQAIRQLLLDDTCRLLTILGPGGAGKTRLAYELLQRVQSDFADSVTFVDLQSVQQPDGIITALIEALQIPSSGTDTDLDVLKAALRDRQQLIVLDNFEHLLDGAILLSDMLAAAPELHLLVTSREALRLQEEYLYRLHGLTVTVNDDNISPETNSAVQLFLERVRQVQQTFQPDIPTVTAICRLVDGNPLAIELAAGWAQVLPIEDIHQEIQYCFDFLQTDRRNVPERHRSIRAVFKSSWHLLDSNEQTVLMRLAFFPQSFTRDAAQQIAGASLRHLASLQHKSLLNLSADGRYGMHALIRQFAVDTLEIQPAEYARIRELHSDYFVSVVQEQTVQLRGHNQGMALAVMQADLQNIYAGWQGVLEYSSPERIVNYAFGLALYHQMKSRIRDGLNTLTLSSVQRKKLSSETIAQIDLLRGFMLIILLQNEDGVEAIWQGLQNLSEPPLWCGMTLVPAVNQPELLGERYDTLHQRIREMLENADDTWQQAWLYKALGEFDFIAENYDHAVSSFEESAARFRQVGDTWGVSWAYGNLGQALVHLRRYTQAADIYQRGLAICEKIGDPGGYVDVMNKQARLALRQSHIDDAISILHESLTQALDNQISPGSLTYLLHTYSHICIEQGNTDDAIAYLTVLVNNAVVQRGWREPEIDALHTEREALRDAVSVDVFERAVRRGKATDLYAAMQQILNTDLESAGAASETLIEPLTDREKDVLKLIAAGLSNQDIADKLVIAVGTVKTHAHNIYGKLAVTNRTEAAARAHNLNLI